MKRNRSGQQFKRTSTSKNITWIIIAFLLSCLLLISCGGGGGGGGSAPSPTPPNPTPVTSIIIQDYWVTQAGSIYYYDNMKLEYSRGSLPPYISKEVYKETETRICGTTYSVYGGNSLLTEQAGLEPQKYGYVLLGTGTSTKTFSGNYSYYLVLTAPNNITFVDTIQGSNGSYFPSRADWDISNYTNIGGAPDGNYSIIGTAGSGGYVLIDAVGRNLTSITIYIASGISPEIKNSLFMEYDSSGALVVYGDVESGGDYSVPTAPVQMLPSEMEIGRDYSATIKMTKRDALSNYKYQSTNTFAFKAMGFETITVPAGTYQAVKLKVNVQWSNTNNKSGIESEYRWYAFFGLENGRHREAGVQLEPKLVRQHRAPAAQGEDVDIVRCGFQPFRAQSWVLRNR